MNTNHNTTRDSFKFELMSKATFYQQLDLCDYRKIVKDQLKDKLTEPINLKSRMSF